MNFIIEQAGTLVRNIRPGYLEDDREPPVPSRRRTKVGARMVFGDVESIVLDKAKEKGDDDCETGESSNS